MLREATATGDTVELAQEAACKALGLETYEAEFEILEMPTRKTFGLFGGNPAKVRAFIKSSPAQAAADYLRDILNHMGLYSVKLDITEQEEGAMISLSGEDIGFIIGHRGETLDSLQYLAGLVGNHVDNSYYRVTLDIGDYRKKRHDTLEVLGQKIAAKAVRSGRNSSLEPMNPYERRIIHTAVQEIAGAKSWSEGEGMGRHVVIGPEGGERLTPRTFTPNTNTAGARNNSFAPRSGNPAARPAGNNRTGNYNRPDGNATRKPSYPPRPAAAPAAPRPAAPVTPPQPTPPRPHVTETRAPLYGRIEPKK